MDQHWGVTHELSSRLVDHQGTRKHVYGLPGIPKIEYTWFSRSTVRQRFIATDTSALPFIAASLRRHLEQFPSADNGLSRTERQALTVLRDRGSLSGPGLFVAVRDLEEQVFMGDASLYRIVADLSEARHPLVQISDTLQHRLGNVTITETGRKVLEGRADHIDLNGIDRWLGGVHLVGEKAAWRWDRASERIVSHQ